ncbi:MAG: HEPN domain-containing protein [bacterium]|nr:HEPN domain-containing protein [bacterium]
MKDDSAKLLAKAERAIRAARTLLDADDVEFAAGRIYYAMFYVAEALLYERDLQFRKHSAVHAAYGKEFAKTGVLEPRFHRWLLGAFNLRLQMDYSFDAATSHEEVEEVLEQARTFLAAARSYLSTSEASGASSSPPVAGADTGDEAPPEEAPADDTDSASTDA